MRVLANVSQEATGDAARFASDGADFRCGNSWPMGWPRRLSSRLLGGVDGLWMMLFVKGDEREVPNGTED